MTESKQIYNIYCDESCHLENDKQKVMVLGALWCLDSVKKEINNKIRLVKEKHGISKKQEVKWTKISPAKIDFYKDLVRLYFSEPELHFRAVVIQDKDKLDHVQYAQDHDTWYYKMMFNLLKVVLEPNAKYRIYLDKKDTRSGEKINKLHDVLCHSKYDFSKEIIEKVQSVHSHEIELLQLADLLIGAVGYVNKGLQTSSAKLEIIALIQNLSHYSLNANTLLRENKLNLFFWTPAHGKNHAE